MSLTSAQKVAEARVRRKAWRRQRLVLHRSRRRDPLAVDYGLYQLCEPDGEIVRESASLDALEEWLDG